ncbi:hypothetical protein [Parasitella parasitica]|uniref:Uncharacterized protein n=1 Tax=Parasitella parasitica TaxID=35722 RepID=A0A0B7NDW3_9FUNG|nr:hypothetical protein [Parasitella parasitica]
MVVEKVVAIFNGLFKSKWERDNEITRMQHNNKKVASNKRCIYHPGLSNHTTSECLLRDDKKQRRLAANKKLHSNNRPCKYCKEPNWTPKHNLVCKKINGNKKKGARKTIVPVPREEKDDDNMDTDIDDSASEDQNLTFAAMHIKDDNCEYQYLNEPPTNILSKNSIILPITLENNNVKVRTYFLLDTGSSFSCISPKLAKILDNWYYRTIY